MAESVRSDDVASHPADPSQILVQRFVQETHTKRNLDAQLREVNERIGKLETAILDQWASTGITKVTCDGMTVYTGEQLSVKSKDGDTQAVRDALMASGHADLTTVNHQRLKAFVKECLEADTVLPEQLTSAIEINRVKRIFGRRAS